MERTTDPSGTAPERPDASTVAATIDIPPCPICGSEVTFRLDGIDGCEHRPWQQWVADSVALAHLWQVAYQRGTRITLSLVGTHGGPLERVAADHEVIAEGHWAEIVWDVLAYPELPADDRTEADRG